MKHVINEIVESLTYTCNKSFQSGIFPNGMKTAIVVPIFKNGDIHHYTNKNVLAILQNNASPF